MTSPPSGSKASRAPDANAAERSLRLPTGLRVELAVSRSPLGHDVAVCSTDTRGSPGLLNELVLGALGYDVQRLARDFHPPATLIQSTTVPVLVVQTIRADAVTATERAAALVEHLRHGLTLLDEVHMRTHVWVPLLGTGAGQLSMPQSLRALLTALAAWDRGHTHRVTIAAPNETALSEVMAALDTRTPPPSAAPPRKRKASKQDEQDPGEAPDPQFRTQPHVTWALSVAWTLSQGEPVQPWHVAQAITLLGERARSSSFLRFRALARIEADLPDAALDADASHGESFDPSLLSDGLRQQLLWAQGSANQLRSSALRGRQLVTAALLCDDTHLSIALRKAGTSLEALRDRWYRHATRAPEPRAPWDEWWEHANVPLPGPQRAGHVTETDQGEDKLGVEAEAAAFARLILDERIEPPLSIGLLGDWGSGKSFFIEQIKKQMAELRGSAGLHEHVVEIEFNAWHASDANLWASLVTHIFDEIWQKVAKNGSEATQKRAREQLTRAISQAHGALHEAEDQVDVARNALKEAEGVLTERRRALAWDKHVRSLTRARLGALAEQAGFRAELDTITDVETAATSLVSSSRRLGLMLTSVLERPVLRLGLPTGALLVLAGAVWLGVEHLHDLRPSLSWLARGIQLVSAVVGGLGALLAPLKVASGHVNRLSTVLRRVTEEYDAAVQTAAVEVQATVARARLELTSAEASVAVARQRLADLMNQQAALDPGRRLSAFLQERVASAPYRAQQGIISLVHRDFQQLSSRMRAWREARQNPAPDAPAIPADIQPFDRIVLYVDDLDRCRPQQVVQMLEAVHLLLALDLFVVVVAVDSRWLTRALQVHYKELLASDDDVVDDGMRRSTAQNYLEKIFQITYALGPMNPAKFGDYVRHLTDTETHRAAPLEPKAGAVSSSSPGSTASLASTSEAAPSDAPILQTTSSRPPSAEAGLPSGVRSAIRSREPRSVPISADECEFLSLLGPLLPTPRLAKRLVNAYRLVKAMKDPDVLDDEDQRNRYQATLVMLAILFGHPRISGELFRRLHEQSAPFDDPSRRLSEAIREQGADGSALAEALDAIGIELRVGDCVEEPAQLARYSLVTGHDWHLWKPAPSKGRRTVEAESAAE